MKIEIKRRGRAVNLNVRKTSKTGRFFGLMFKPRTTQNLLFEFRSSSGIHSLFVFFPFLAVWLDKSNNVVEYGVVKPFTFSIKPKNKVSKLIEIPINKENEKILKFLVG